MASWLERLKDEVARNKLSASKLALRAGIPPRTAQSILYGERRASFDNMIMIARGLGISLDELAGLPPPDPELVEDEAELLGYWRRISDPRVRTFIITALRAAAE